ncbi:MAG: SDR family NAD(P)-dependent oxidoreductase [Parvibaculales bacterium]
MTQRKYALVTGASAGIGQEYADVLAQNGYDLVLTARREERLAELAGELETKYGIQVHYFAHDLSDPKAVGKLVKNIEKAGLEIDFLLNNAGYTVPGKFDMAKWSAQQELITTMLGAPSELIHAFGPKMREKGRGYIVNVASVAGLLPGAPGGTLYGPIKSFVVKFSQALYAEYAPSGVHVQGLCPGFVMSEFHDMAGNRDKMNRLPKYMWLDRRYLCETSFQNVMVNKGPICVPGLFYKVLTSIVKLLPSNFAARQLARHDRNAATLPHHAREK